MTKDHKSTLTIEEKIYSLSLDQKDLEKLIEILSIKADEAGDLEIKNLKKPDDQSEEKYQNFINEIKDCFKLRLVIKDEDQRNLIGPVDKVIGSSDFPEEILSVYIDCGSNLKNIHNIYSQHSFQIFLDFSKPKIFDLSFLPSQGTPNASNISIQGINSTWVKGVSAEVLSFIEKRYSTFSKVHNHSVYDILLWILGFPFAFWICYKITPFIAKLKLDSEEVLKIAVYVYVFWGALFFFRIIFHYLRWVCPLVEYRSKNNSIIKHRIFLGMLILSSFSGLLQDFIMTVVHLVIS